MALPMKGAVVSIPFSRTHRPSPSHASARVGTSLRRNADMVSVSQRVRVMKIRAEGGEEGAGTPETQEESKEVDAGYEGEGIKPLPPRAAISAEMKEKLRSEYIGLGGSENQAMGSNYFLIIMGVVAVLAVLSKLTGAI